MGSTVIDTRDWDVSERSVQELEGSSPFIDDLQKKEKSGKRWGGEDP